MPAFHSPAREAALLKWVNTFPLASPVDSVEDLTTGMVFSKMLAHLDPAYAISDLELQGGGGAEWLRRKICLEAVYKSLRRYIRNNIESDTINLDYLTAKENLDIDSIAEHDDFQQTMKLLTIFLMVALHSPNAQSYTAILQEKLDRDAQLEIMNLVTEMHELHEEHEKHPTYTDPILPANLRRDFDLAFEKEHGKVINDLKTLQKKHADFITRFEQLQFQNTELHERNETVEKQVRALEKASSSGQNEFRIQAQKKTIEELESIIEGHETENEDNRVKKQQMSKELNSLRQTAERHAQLDDEVKMLKSENSTLVKKANMVDHFQRKLEQQSIIEKDNARLREQVDVLEANQKDYDQVHMDNETYKKELEEKRSTLSHHEIIIFEGQQLNRTLKNELRSYESKIGELNSKSMRDEEFINNLQEQLKTGGDVPLSPTIPTAGGTGMMSLEQELEQSEDPSHLLRLENARLKTENQFLKSGSAGTTNTELRIELEQSENIRRRYEETIEDLTVKHTLGQDQLKAIIGSSPDAKLVDVLHAVVNMGDRALLTGGIYRDEAIASTKKAYSEVNQELNNTKNTLAEVQSELNNRVRELLAAKADLEAMSAEEIDGLEILKRTNQIITSSLQKELLLLQAKLKCLEIDLQQQQTHLIQALLAKDKLENEIASKKAGPEAEDQLENDDNQLEATSTDNSTIPPEQNESHNQVVQDLQRRLKKAEEGGADAQKAAHEALIRNLTRENSLMATAWYDLASRLQSNHVVLQRRQDAPKSWLSKQRQMVNATQRR